MQKIDFIIPHLNYSGLRKTLETIRNKTPKENVGKIILIDQNSEGYQQVDDLIDIHIKIKNQGFARANNLGIRLSDAEFVACWNDDCEVIHPKWIQGIEETFRRYGNALCVNPASPRNPSYSGGPPVDDPLFIYKEDITEEEYDKLVTELGKGFVVDGICMFAPIFRRELLERVKGVIPGKCWFDEAFFPGGGEDYDLNRRAYLSGMRCLGTNLSYIYHWWYKTKRPDTGKEGVKYDNYFNQKWLTPDCQEPDIYGKQGLKTVPLNKIRYD